MLFFVQIIYLCFLFACAFAAILPRQKSDSRGGIPSAAAEAGGVGRVRKEKGGRSLPSMQELGRASGTDKVLHHGYDRFYPFFLERWRRRPIKMLEIGYLHGNSFAMWMEYFPRAHIFVMEKDGVHGDYSQRVKDSFYNGDQGNTSQLQAMLGYFGVAQQGLDFIIDDGSHHPEHQRTSLVHLFEHGLKPGGVYIIEDIEMNYWTRGETYGKTTAFGRDHPDSLVNQLKGLVDSVNREYLPSAAAAAGGGGSRSIRSTLGEYLDEWVSSVFFGHNCVVINKMTVEEKSIHTREYRHKAYVG